MIDKLITAVYLYAVSVIGLSLTAYRIYRWQRLNRKNLFSCKWTLNNTRLFTIIMYCIALILQMIVTRKMQAIGYPYVDLNFSMIAVVAAALIGDFVDLVLKKGITDSVVYSSTAKINFDKLENFIWQPVKDEQLIELQVYKKYKRYPDYVPAPIFKFTFEKALQEEIEGFLIEEKKLKLQKTIGKNEKS
ncbi:MULTISPECIES: hypothetical protein [unclassified Fusibacter]|uniref:hypothetical protein n=1 Tax=unclassified Fusibacter TaxID=2624464 RepID=UPI0010106463|nr:MULTISPECIES: hypothetical protein [unclassified Fusibacter]MCK8059008.1 hypothetical protein [Fusibacter sp. A2]NPE22419.1 hypothetical protein [Fusibacter sp. A1]RXV60525.1 hypothetical protein DWB64_11275 [Fusibacter sp. A1]